MARGEGGGRPLIPIDPLTVEKLAQIGCKTKEIADYFGVCEDTISGRFSAELTKGRSEVRMSLRRWQLESAKKGNVAMLIWLGKQMLGQQDRTELILSKVPDDVLMEEAQRRLEDGTKS